MVVCKKKDVCLLWVYIILYIVPLDPKKWGRQKAWFESEWYKFCSEGKWCQNVRRWGKETAQLNIIFDMQWLWFPSMIFMLAIISMK